MLKAESKQAVKDFFASADTEFRNYLKERTVEDYDEAARIVLESQANGGRLHVTGIG